MSCYYERRVSYLITEDLHFLTNGKLMDEMLYLPERLLSGKGCIVNGEIVWFNGWNVIKPTGGHASASQMLECGS